MHARARTATHAPPAEDAADGRQRQSPRAGPAAGRLGPALADGHAASPTLRGYLASRRFQRHFVALLLLVSLGGFYLRTPPGHGHLALSDDVREARMRISTTSAPPAKRPRPKRKTTAAPVVDAYAPGDGAAEEIEQFDDEIDAGEPAPIKADGASAQADSVADADDSSDADADDADDADGDDFDDGMGKRGAPANQKEPDVKTFTNKLGEWQWMRKADGTAVWRKLARGADGTAERAERSWYDRSTVQARLDFERFVKCPPKPEPELPPLQGLPVLDRTTILDEYIVHQGNFQRLGKGPQVNRTQRIRNVEALPLDGENTLRSYNWGTCAIVGNSGMLRLEELARSIDSHDTVIRLNHAPTYGYSRRVGRKVTHRFLNRLWTRTYRNGGGMKRGTVLPLEKDLTFVVTRATSQEYELLMDYLLAERPDVKVLYLSSRATSMATPLLTKYRERLCKAGYGPYKGLNVPSSGFVAIYMLLPLCDKITIYGFGVEGMGNVKNLKHDDEYGYHYFKGVGSRHVGDDVHSFDNEEIVLRAMAKEGVLDLCQYVNPKNASHNWACGCRAPNVLDCKPPLGKNGKPRTDDDDCDVDDCMPPSEPPKGGGGKTKGTPSRGVPSSKGGRSASPKGRTRHLL